MKDITDTVNDVCTDCCYVMGYNYVRAVSRTIGYCLQGRIQDLIGGGGWGGPDRDWPKTAILGPQFCRILVLGPHFWWSGGSLGPQGPPGSTPGLYGTLLLPLPGSA